MVLFHLTVAPGEVQINVSNVVVSKDDNVSMTCLFSGGPNNIIQWRKDGTILRDETLHILQINEVTNIDGGNYTCMVSNEVGSSDHTITLYVEPYITTEPSTSERAQLRDRIVFTCRASGFPEPQISWIKLENGSTVANTDMLIFDSIRYSDFGFYHCIASAQTLNGMELTDAITASSLLIGDRNMNISKARSN